MIRVEYSMCKACRRKAHRKYDAWNDFAEHWATKGDSLKPPYIRCPNPIIEPYLKNITNQVESYVKEHIPEAFGVKINFPEKTLFDIGEPVPTWCPYKETGWAPEDDMKMIWVNGEYIQDYAQRGRTYEFND